MTGIVRKSRKIPTENVGGADKTVCGVVGIIVTTSSPGSGAGLV